MKGIHYYTQNIQRMLQEISLAFQQISLQTVIEAVFSIWKEKETSIKGFVTDDSKLQNALERAHLTIAEKAVNN